MEDVCKVPIMDWITFWKNQKMTMTEKDLQSLLTYEGGWYGEVNEAEFVEYVKKLKSFYNLDGSIYEIGCGPGAHLYVLQSFGHAVGGLDVNEEFISFARNCLKNADFDHFEACAVPTDKKYDYILISNSINYFPSKEYVYQTLSKCVLKMNKGILLTEVNDSDYYDEYRKGLQHLNEQQRLDELQGNDFQSVDDFYYHAERLSFDKSFFIRFARDFNLSITIQRTSDFLTSVAISKNRFNVFLNKNVVTL